MNTLWTPCGRRDRVGPGTLCCSAHNWTNGSLSNKIQRNYKGWKITVCTVRLGQDTKRSNNPAATSEEPGAKTGSWEQKQGIAHAPYTQYTKGGKLPKPTPPAKPLDTPLFSFHLLLLNGRASKGTCCILAPYHCSRGPSKALPDFLVSDQFLLIKEAKKPGP